MSLTYKLEKRGGSFFVELKQKGTKRRLYLDMLKSLAKESDKPALSLLVKIQLKFNRNPDTVTFENIQIPAKHIKEVICLMKNTGRMVGDIEKPAQKPLEVLPQLVLNDQSGCFADLWMDYVDKTIEFNDFAPTVLGRPRLKKEEKSFENDLLEAGFTKKIVENSNYYCPKEKVKDALLLLIDVGWQVIKRDGEKLSRGIEISQEKDRIAIRGQARALIDHALQMEGVWEADVLYVKKTRAGSLLPLLEEDDIKWDEKLIHLLKGLKNGQTIQEAPVLKSFRAKLLPYQQKGVDWLHFLYSWGFSGLLADEMGLGKTVQVLAFLSAIRTNLPVLIVTPASLTFNWRREIERFYPELEFTLISYTALRLNIETLRETQFEVVILDESNAIKQATTQTARAVRKLSSTFRICISGTPMENRLEELISQFRFLMPDLLERGSSLETVKRRIRPFIMRRKKDEVGLNLPEKIEQLSWIEMTESQKALYDSYKQGIQIDGASKMQVLEAILRLRQICVDPRLVGSDIVGAKLAQLVREVSEIRVENRKILIFSQFTSMLKLILQEIPDAIYLDGSVSLKRREELILQFQEDPNCCIFLLSLKAGGVGLNLTAADYVYLLDPWWNEAVENQAIDRAHRIGQKNTVIAKRMVTANTIEEKMLQLKEKKQSFADQLLDIEGNLTFDDLLNLLV